MTNPYVRKDDILKLIERLAGDSQYINKKDLQKAITFSKEYKQPKEEKIYRPYGIFGGENSLNEKYLLFIKEMNDIPESNDIYQYVLTLGLRPPFYIKYNEKEIPITYLVGKLDIVGNIFGISKGTRNTWRRKGYINRYKQFTLIHSQGKSIIPISHYNVYEIHENLINCDIIVY